jgi:Flp pilus assembly pilin Flp
MLRSRAHRRVDDRGAAAVEFALVLPILLLLVFGIVQFGITFTQWLEMEHAAREGARWGSLGYTAAQVQAKVRDAAPGLSPALTDAQITVTPTDPLNHSGDEVSVHIDYNSMVLPIIGPLLGFTGNEWPLQATAVNRIE